MKSSTLKFYLIPITVLILGTIMYFMGYFQMIFAALIVLIASALEYGKGLFASMGFQRAKRKAFDLLVVAPLLAAVIFFAYLYLLIPGVTYLTGAPMDFSAFEVYKGDLPAILTLTLFAWVSAAFGEEIVFRGYLMRQFVKFFGDGKLALVLNILIFGVLFGFLHAYQGISGQIITGIIGMLLATIFYLRKYDLWFCIALHGFIDTIAMVFIYYGI
ncbi:CPBP family intramembrane glutamic endopeptidase [Flagellimonas sp. DF-77]|uniref:CPBP family intramembrane glutamic endopeptidase n=1 Tax=Flagellimonas algarum TaxID=3230298 RepID=UPI003398FE89